MNRSLRDGGKLAGGVESENAGTNDGCEVDAAEEAGEAKAAQASVKHVGAAHQAKVCGGQNDESYSTERVDDSEARAFNLLVMRPASYVCLYSNSSARSSRLKGP